MPKSTVLTKIKNGGKVVAGASFCSFVVAAICGQDEIADAAASVFWTAAATAIGAYVAEEIQVACE